MTKITKLALPSVFAALVLASSSAVGQPLPPQSELRFQSWWEDASDFKVARNLSIVRTLVKNKFLNCPSMYVSESLDYEDLFLVACYRGNFEKSGGDSSEFLIVNTHANKVHRTRRGLVKELPPCLPYQVGKCDPDYAKKKHKSVQSKPKQSPL